MSSVSFTGAAHARRFWVRLPVGVILLWSTATLAADVWLTTSHVGIDQCTAVHPGASLHSCATWVDCLRNVGRQFLTTVGSGASGLDGVVTLVVVVVVRSFAGEEWVGAA